MADRMWVRDPGEWYRDLLALECFIKGRSMTEEACNLLCVRLMQREEYRNKALDHMATKRGITREQMIHDILKGIAKPMSLEEYRQFAAENPDPDEES